MFRALMIPGRPAPSVCYPIRSLDAKPGDPGASGSIGQSTLKVLRHNPGRWQVLALTAARSVDAMLRDCLEFSPVCRHGGRGAASELAGRLKATAAPPGCCPVRQPCATWLLTPMPTA